MKTPTETQTPNGGSLERRVRCPECGEDWPEDCEQAVSVDIVGHCICCSSQKGSAMSLNEIVHEKVRRLTAKGISHDYDLTKYPLRAPNAPGERPGATTKKETNAN